MSPPPFITPGKGRRPRAPAGGRRAGPGRVVLLAVVLAAIAAVLGAIASSTGRSTREARLPARALHPHRRAATSAPALSPTGLRLGRPPFTLRGIGAPQQDPLRLALRTPPRAGLLFNLSSGRVLWQRDAGARLPIASLTKMMTALLTVKSAPPGAPVLVTRNAVHAGGSKVGVLPVGRHVPLESMLYGLMLPSGNDAADALAEHIAGSVARFVARMNAEAAKLGMGCTRFSSPSGYYDEDNFSCASDLAVLAHIDLAQARIAQVARTFHAVVPFPIKGGRLYLNNHNPLLIYGYPGVTGLKTGYTLAAGRCLVATAERAGVRLGVILLDSRDPATQAAELLDRGFERIYHRRPVTRPAIPKGA
jgi:serine-type D-Ala-D-Ala carboxypeptidase (penicillin-binding protein 5/6)